ncbi:hypothetical protein BLOT_015023 [Blomia tropicalis]|nr:hypothetical protein BLOT_015023 [Blomia tropicalis]
MLNNEMISDDEQTDINRTSWKLLTPDVEQNVIKKYENLRRDIKMIDVDRENFLDIAKKLEQSVSEQNDILSAIGVNEIISVDSNCISETTDVTFSLAKKFNADSKFNMKQLIINLRQSMLNDPERSIIDCGKYQNRIIFEDLILLGSAFEGIQSKGPQMNRFFKQALEQPPAPKAKLARIPRAKLGSKSQPKQHDIKKLNDVDESEKRLKYVHKKLYKMTVKNEKSIPLMQATINPNSFPRTIENFFNIAILTQQNQVCIEIPDGSIEPSIHAFNMPKESDTQFSEEQPILDDVDEDESSDSINDGTNDNVPKKKAISSILSLDMSLYKNLIHIFDISRPAWQ